MRGLHRYKGYTISRGGYVDTPDDRSDGWYVDCEESRTADRRGPGYQSLDEARAAIRRDFILCPAHKALRAALEE